MCRTFPVRNPLQSCNGRNCLSLYLDRFSGGELQRVAITMCLGQPADIYLIDEPSAYLDSEQRIIASKVKQSSGPICAHSSSSTPGHQEIYHAC